MIRRFALCLALALAASAAQADNPFGLMLWPAPGQDLSLTAARASALGVAWYRPPTLYVDRWREGAPCGACRALGKSGLALVLTVRNGGHDGPPRKPSTPPADPALYERILADILDQWKPALLVVEDEENRPARYDDEGKDPPLAYQRQLTAACRLAHARQIQCSNGGLSFEATAALTWLTFLREGKPDIACDYARRALPTHSALCFYRSEEAVPAELRARLLQNADKLLPVYRASPIDAVNIHWYGGDATALAQTIDVMARLAGKPVMSNEIGLKRRDFDPSRVRPLMRAAMAGHLAPAVWFSIDGEDSLSLFDEHGGLRPAGEEFAHQMSGRK